MRSILIVEDVDAMRELLVQMVQSIDGFSVSGTASNVWEARLELSRRRPHFILLDEVLPGESSLDFLKEASDLQVGVLLITGMNAPSHTLPKEALGRLTKPSWETLSEDQKRFERFLKAH